jgi:hypothetical protein
VARYTVCPLLQGFEMTRSDFDDLGFSISDNTQHLGFRFGVRLHDVERLLDDARAT